MRRIFIIIINFCLTEACCNLPNPGNADSVTVSATNNTNDVVTAANTADDFIMEPNANDTDDIMIPPSPTANLDDVIINAINHRYGSEQAFENAYRIYDITRTSNYIAAAFTITSELRQPSAYVFPPSWDENCNSERLEDLLTNLNADLAYVNLVYISMAPDRDFIEPYISALNSAIIRYENNAPSKNLEYAHGALSMLRWLIAHPNMLRWLKDHVEELLPREEEF